jgi:hypothetical protein
MTALSWHAVWWEVLYLISKAPKQSNNICTNLCRPWWNLLMLQRIRWIAIRPKSSPW